MTTIFAHGRAVLPDRVLDDAVLVVEDGRIASVEASRPGAVPREAVDLHGAFLLPGLVDSHSDGLEKELRPRPNVELDIDFAVTSFEGRARAAGVTTCYHGIGYEVSVRKERTIERALRIVSALRDRASTGCALVDHRLLHRLDARDPNALAALQGALDGASFDGMVPLVSFEDHTPGQGQYRDSTYYRRWLEGSEGIDEQEAQRRVDELVQARASQAWHRDVALRWLADAAAAGRARLLAHDPVTEEEISIAAKHGVAVAEFPTTLEAARAARQYGMEIVAGAPNVLRGGSHSGNVSAAELVAEGVADTLSSDYLPSALLAAVFRLAAENVLPLPAAVGLVTSGPARTVGLTDRGALLPGLRADLVAVTVDRGWPTVRLVRSAADQVALAVS
jgi:alpha-D-ribose 1-methylphosphonate 5-triphosphate diphosphatase